MESIPTLPGVHAQLYWVCKCRPLDARVHPMTDALCRDCRMNRGDGRAASPIELCNLTRYKACP